MVRHSTNTASLCSVLLAALIVSLSLVGVAAAQTTSRGQDQTALLGPSRSLINSTGDFNTASVFNALYANTTGDFNTASGFNALYANTTGDFNTASGVNALLSTTTGGNNTASGAYALLNNITGSKNNTIRTRANGSV